MQRFVSKALQPFDDLRRRIPTFRPRTPTIDENAEDIYDRNERGAITRLSERNAPIDPSTRQRLDGLSSFRIHSTAIRFTLPGSYKGGGKADVAQATYRRGDGDDEQVVAVKKLRYHRDMKRKKFENEFVHEVEVMARFKHKNIVRLIGFVEDLENGTAWIVLSWEPNGNVGEFLATGDWEIPERISLIRDTFEGVKYLHTRRPPICHGDLKSLNILVNSSCRAVITDFGSAREISAPKDELAGDESGSQTQEVPTTEQACPPIHVGATGNQLTLTGPAWSLRWAAPEVMNGADPGFSSDIWAAGWVCWEVMTDKVPFPELNSAGVITLTVIQGEVPSPREEGQLGQIVALCSLMTDCWAFDPKARPNIARCYEELKWMPSTTPSGGNSSGSQATSIELLLRKGQMNYTQQNYEEAVSLFKQALSLAEPAGNQKATADALRWLGAIYRNQLKLTQAAESHNRAQEIYARIKDDRGRASTLLGLGEVYRAQSKYTKAEELYTRAQEIFARIGSDLGRANALEGLGCVYFAQSKYTEAEESFTRSHEVFDRIGHNRARADVLRWLGHAYRARSKYTEAEESYTRAQEIYTRIGHAKGRAATLRGIGHLHQQQGRNAEAFAHYTDARDLYTQIGLIKRVEETSRLLPRVLPDHSSTRTSP